MEAAILIGDLKILPDSYEVYLQDDLLDLTPKEFELLLFLANHRGKFSPETNCSILSGTMITLAKPEL